MTDIKNITHPKQFYRWEIIKIYVNFSFNINQDHIIRKKWNIYPILPDKALANTSIDLSDNPSVFTNKLIIKSNTLSYGLYKLKLEVELEMNTIDGSTRYETFIETHIEIIAGGIALFSLENGLDFVKIGTEQGLVFNPLEHGYDMDFIINIKELQNVNFYCFKMEINQISNEFKIDDNRFSQDFNHSNDLRNFKRYITSFNECINDKKKINFYENSKVMTIEPKSWPYDKNSFSLFLIETYYLDVRYYQFIKVQKLNVPMVPQGSTK